jgi:aminoglycoside/choline kinase family phosphotransferase
MIVLYNPGRIAENDAYWNIGRHLRDRGAPVPRLYEYERDEGWILLEDLGDRSLQKAAGDAACEQEIEDLYGPVLDGLLLLQSQGPHGFEEKWCYQGTRYDSTLMRERESGYFLQAFLRGHLGWSGDETPLLQEFRDLAEQAGQAPAHFLLHRDFQSRNILFPSSGRPHVIDFQGARWGPLQYDVAALTLDPYVGLGVRLRDRILGMYLARLEASGAMTADRFLADYPLIALHRNLQILGAFGFLGKRKPFFLQWIPRAVENLRRLANDHPEWKCSRLRERIEDAWHATRKAGPAL